MAFFILVISFLLYLAEMALFASAPSFLSRPSSNSFAATFLSFFSSFFNVREGFY